MRFLEGRVFNAITRAIPPNRFVALDERQQIADAVLGELSDIQDYGIWGYVSCGCCVNLTHACGHEQRVEDATLGRLMAAVREHDRHCTATAVA